MLNMYYHLILKKKILCSRERFTVLDEETKGGPERLSDLYVVSNGFNPMTVSC